LLHDPDRHEPLHAPPWNEGAARAAIARIVADTEAAFSPHAHWPLAPLDADGGPAAPAFNLYFGAAGVVEALRRLEQRGAAALRRSYAAHVDTLLPLNRAALAAEGADASDVASYLMGDTGILLVAHAWRHDAGHADRLAALIDGNADHPARELMWGAPGTMLAALVLHHRTGEARWAERFRASARRLWTDLAWSARLQCRYATQAMYGRRSAYLGAVHGFASVAAPLVAGRALLPPAEWKQWERCIVETMRATVVRDDGHVNWPPEFDASGGPPAKRLMQFCHGAPGVVVALAGLPTDALDDLLIGAGEAIWKAGPLRKGSNLCHGTGGNGCAFLVLFARTGDERWLERARAFAMHGIAQVEAHARTYGQGRYSLWTGDPGFALFLDDCVQGCARFPLVDDRAARASG
jgi:hypothetical protein